MNPIPERKPTTLLFSPFYFTAGAKALLLGLAAILLAGFVGAFSRTHFDGVLDTHVGTRAPLWFHLSEGVIDWLCLAAVLFAAGKVFSKTAFRAVDVLGTQALARWPTVFVSLIAFPSGYHRFGRYLIARWVKSEPGSEFAPTDAAVFSAVLLATILLTVWIVVLMYRAFSVSCNIRGGKAVGAFIGALLAAEVLSKLALYALILLVPNAVPRATSLAAESPGTGVEHDGVQIVEFMTTGDFAAVTARFDTTVRNALPEAKLRDVWQGLQAQVGPFKARLQNRVAKQQGYDVVFVTCRFERATLDAKVVFDSRRQIAGLFFVPRHAAVP